MDKVIEYIANRELINQKDIDNCKEEARKTNKTLEEMLINKSLINEDTYLKMYKQVTGLETTDLRGRIIDPNVISIMSLDIAEKNKAIPLYLENKNLCVAMADPTNLTMKDNMSLKMGYKIRASYALPFQIVNAIKENYVTDTTSLIEENVEDMIKEVETDESEDGIVDIQSMTENSKTPLIVRLVNQIIFDAISKRASDIHIEPMTNSIRVRYRIDGSLVIAFDKIKKTYLNPMISRIKIMANLDIAERRHPQDGKMGLMINGNKIEIRVATSNSVLGEEVTMRIIDMSKSFSTLEEAGFSNDICNKLDIMVHRPYGLLIVSGPTGSGKTSTLYTLLDKVNQSDKNILTVEDPVERQINGLRQHQINKLVSFNAYLESFLRHDPDIIMIGEIRDRETAETAVKAALTGHLVLATLHSNNAASTISRLVEMGVQSYLVAGSIIGSLGQRLIRRICPDCKEEVTLTDDEVVFIEKNSKRKVGDTKFYRGHGCPKCNNSGYYGRIVVGELLSVNETIRKELIDGTNEIELSETAIKEKNMVPFVEDAIEKLFKGTTTIEEVKKVAFSI